MAIILEVEVRGERSEDKVIFKAKDIGQKITHLSFVIKQSK
jgi:hypothetical protein